MQSKGRDTLKMSSNVTVGESSDARSATPTHITGRCTPDEQGTNIMQEVYPVHATPVQ